MISRYEQEDVLWIDLLCPTKKEIRQVIEENDINPEIGDALLEPNRNPLVELYNQEAIFLVLHFPTFRENNVAHRREIDFVITEKLLITVHYETIDIFTNFAKDFETNTLLQKDRHQHAGFIYFRLMKHLYQRFSEELEGVEDRIESAKEHVFQGGEKEMVKALSDINKDLLDFKQAIRPHKNVLKSLEIAGNNYFDDQVFIHYLHTISQEHEKITDTITAHKETLDEVRHTNDSLLRTRSTQVMKTLTVITFATYPSVFLAELFGVNAKYNPILGEPNDFWIILLIILAATIATFTFFIYKRWF